MATKRVTKASTLAVTRAVTAVGASGGSGVVSYFAYVEDSFTAADSTLLTAHTPDVDGSGTGWSTKLGNGFAIQFNQAGRIAGQNVNSSVVNAGGATVCLEVELVVGSGGTNAAPGVMLRTDEAFGSTPNGYVIWLNRSANELQLVRLVSGSPTTLDSAAISLSGGESVGLVAAANGNAISAAAVIDGVVVSVSATDATHSGTYAGLYSVDNGTTTDSTFDNFRLSVGSAVTVTSSTRIVQRSGASGSVVLSGSYSGTPTAIQARAVDVADGTTVTAYTTVDESLSGGTWSGTLSVPNGGPYYLQARAISDSQIGASLPSETIIVGDVFAAIGQSNTSGVGTNNQSYSGTAPAWLVRQTSTTIDEALNDPWAINNGSWGPLLATLVDAHLGGAVPIAFITNATSATGLGPTEPDWLPPSGTEWGDFESQLASQGDPALAAVLWLQGERDAALATSAANYESAEKTLATAVNALSGTPELLSALIGYNTTWSANLDAIRQAKIANWNDGTTLPSANPIDLDLSDEGGDGLHFKTDTELGILAGRIWLALEDAVYAGTNGRGPRLSSATYSGSTIALTFDRDLDTADTTYTASAFAFDEDDGTARTVSSVTRTGTRTVDVVLSGVIDGTAPKISFGTANTAAGATIPKTAAISLPTTINGVSAVALPAEPFFAQAITAS